MYGPFTKEESCLLHFIIPFAFLVIVLSKALNTVPLRHLKPVYFEFAKSRCAIIWFYKYNTKLIKISIP